MNLSAVLLGSENPKALAEYYGKFLGKPVWEDGDWCAFAIGEGGLVIGPHSEVKGANETPGRIMIMIESKDVQADFDKIKATGAKVISEPYHPGEDPKGWL